MDARACVRPRERRATLARLDVLAVLVMLVVWAPERAELELAWDAPPECPPMVEVRARVLATWHERGVVASITAAGTITHSDAGPAPWRLELQVRDGTNAVA
jgi:hypothetical protein